jgi:secreted PhoX family phosphatase
MVDRRRFIQGIVAAAAMPSLSNSSTSSGAAGSKLRADSGKILDLPPGFDYHIISRAGERMSDGFFVPRAHDGMAAFAADDGRIKLIRNHEMNSGWTKGSPFGSHYDALPESTRVKLWDRGGDVTPGLGGTTTCIYNPASGQVEREFLSLAGTEINCAGGATPWGSWLSCEECFELPGTRFSSRRMITRDRHHGYVFEVPADATGLIEAHPIRAMGRFEHEACAVHRSTGIVYMTEDRYYSLFYRYIPRIPGRLMDGGTLQALALQDRDTVMTHNWSVKPEIPLNERLATRWIDLDDVDPVKNDLRLRGARGGAATFARGEGLCEAGESFAFTCTAGGPARAGQVFMYTPSPFEGTPQETRQPGQLSLIAEARADSLLQHCDNLTMAPWGDLVVCEDTASHCGLVGIRPDGSQYPLADNPYSDSELAGVCFSPDGETLFVNIQYPGMTLAINGPWPT